MKKIYNVPIVKIVNNSLNDIILVSPAVISKMKDFQDNCGNDIW